MHTNWCVLIEISMEIGMIKFLIGIIGHCTDQKNLLFLFYSFYFFHVIPTFRLVKSFWVHLSFSSRFFYVCFSLKISIHLVLEIGHVHKEGNAEATVKLFSFSTKYHNRVKYCLKDHWCHIYSLQILSRKHLIYHLVCQWCSAIDTWNLPMADFQ